MTKGAFWIMMIVMMNVARLSGAQYSVELEPDTAKRKVIAIDYGTRTAELYLHPQTPWRIGSSRIAAQDDFLWSGPYGSYGTSAPHPNLHRYLMLGAHSSREYVKITGVLTQDGSGGTPPWFRVTVPAVDIDWVGYESAAQENDEDTRKLFCPVTNDVSKCRKLVIRNPLDSGKLRDDTSLLGSNPDMRLTLRSGYADCFRLRKANGTVFNTGSFNINNIPSWPLELYVEALPNKPPSDLEITLEGPAGPDGARTLDRIIGTTVIKVELDSVSSADFIGHEANGTKVYATAKGSGNVVIQLKSTPSGVSLPSGYVSWTGGSVGSDQLQRIVSKSSLIEGGEDVVATVCGSDVFHGRVYVFKGSPVASGVDIDITLTRDDSMATPFGLTDRSKAWSPSETYDVYYENAKWEFVFAKVAYEIKWGINNGGRTDVPDGTANPFPLGMGMPPGSTEAQKKTQAKSDLTPDATGRAPRTLYWASSLTAQHEQFHVSDWRGNYYNPKAQEAETWIESQQDAVTLSSLVPTDVLNAKKSAFHDKLIEKTDEAQAAYSPDKESRAYADGKDEYQALADSIVP